jgi:FKBP-type peptidyl-prolyl cis-trans isomerase
MRAIFISYRREDTEGHAGRLFRDLAERFGKALVFMDVTGIEPGRDFRRVIEQQVASCGVLLAVIGKDWLTVADAEGRRRLDDPLDFVRLETASALKRDIPVVPVLVHGARIPRPEQLPEDLKELAYRNSVELTHARWESDVQAMINALLPYMDAPPESLPIAPLSPPSPIEGSKPWWRIAGMTAALVIALGAASYFVFEKGEKPTELKAAPDRPARENAESDTASKRVAAERAATADRVARETAESEEVSKRVTAEKAKSAADRIAQEKAESSAKAARVEAEKTETSADRIARERAVDTTPHIAGAWRDGEYPNNGSQIAQDGNRVRFTRWGILPNGVRFEASGSGTIAGRNYTSSYSARYESGATSAGDCSGTVSPDGMRMALNCRDSLLGTFPVTALRQ